MSTTREVIVYFLCLAAFICVAIAITPDPKPCAKTDLGYNCKHRPGECGNAPDNQ
jgi:hypothetical protein